MTALERMLAAAAAEAEDDRAEETPPPADQVKVLTELFGNYRRADRFAPGDLVTPRPDVGLATAGAPHIVLETDPHAEPLMTIDGGVRPGASQFGRVHDIRAACFFDGDYCAFWFESWMLVPWSPPAEDAGATEDGA